MQHRGTHYLTVTDDSEQAQLGFFDSGHSNSMWPLVARNCFSKTNVLQQVINSMHGFRNESSIRHIIDQEDAAIPQSFPSSQRSSVTEAFYVHYKAVLHTCSNALDSLGAYLEERPQDAEFIDQLRDYVERLAGVQPAFSLEEQFNHLYTLRKWVFYVPSILLRNPDRDLMTLAVIAHFYAVALSMDDLFPTVAPVFLSSLAFTPLKEIIDAFDTRPTQGQSAAQIQDFLEFPRQVAAAHQLLEEGRRGTFAVSNTPSNFEGFQQRLAYSIEPGLGGHRSPGFGPPPIGGQSGRSYSTGGAYLGVPTTGSPYQQPTMTLPVMSMSMEPEDLGYEAGLTSELPAGFVASPSQVLWT